MATFKELHTPAGGDFWVDLDTGRFYPRPELENELTPASGSGWSQANATYND